MRKNEKKDAENNLLWWYHAKNLKKQIYIWEKIKQTADMTVMCVCLLYEGCVWEMVLKINNSGLVLNDEMVKLYSHRMLN